MMFRATKGSSWIVMSDIDYPKHDIELVEQEKADDPKLKKQSDQRTLRSVFVVVYQGGVTDFLRQKLNRICDSFGAAK
jgi:hypothetical protein